jgi:Chemoreceptor zinc-binding domain
LDGILMMGALVFPDCRKLFMFQLLKIFFGVDEATDTRPPSDVDMREAMLGLDIDMAKSAHENWKLRLEAYLAGRSQEAFSPETICFDDRCDLGRWIHGPGKTKLGRFPGFTALTSHHKMFHYAASNVVALYQAGRMEEAQRMLEHQLAEFSKNVTQDLDSLQQVASYAIQRRQAQAQQAHYF